MTAKEVYELLRIKCWTVAALADRWEMSRRYVTGRLADEGRGELWNDALRGLPRGPGFYRQGIGRYRLQQAASAAENAGPGLGGLVASEAQLDTISFGTRGVVIDVLRKTGEWVVFWDGGTVLNITHECLYGRGITRTGWVADLGLKLKGTERWKKLDVEARRVAAEKADLNG